METERLIIRRFKEDDWRDLYEYLSNEQVVKYEPYKVFTQEDCKEEAAWRSGQDSFWAVCLKEDGKLIGNVYFSQQEPSQFMTWEMGYVFNPSYYGKGYATEACRRVMQYGFEELGAHRIVAECNPENIPSWKLLERLSMRREGHFLKDIYFHKTDDGEPIWIDTYKYGMLDLEWFKQG